MKRNAIIRIVLYSLALVILLGILGVGLGAKLLAVDYLESDITEDSIPLVSGEDMVSTVVDVSQIRELEIDWAAGSIRIIPDELASQITVTESKTANEKYQMRCFVKENTLHIEFCEARIGIHDTDISKDLLITVPADWQCEKLDIDAAAASVEVRDLKIISADIDAASGICWFSNCAVNDLDVDTASGDVTFIGKLNTLDVDAMSANCHLVITDGQPLSIDVDSMSGDLLLEFPDDLGFAVNMDALSSSLDCDFETVLKNGMHCHGDGGCRINLSALSGDVTIRKHSAHTHTDACYGEHSTCPDKTHHH